MNAPPSQPAPIATGEYLIERSPRPAVYYLPTTPPAEWRSDPVLSVNATCVDVQPGEE